MKTSATIHELPISFRIRYPVFWTGIVLTLIGCGIMYYTSTPDSEKIKNAMQALAIGVGLTGLVYTAINLDTLNSNNLRAINRDKIKQSNELITKWEGSSEYTVVANRIRSAVVGKSTDEVKSFLELNKSNTSTITNEQALVFLLNFFEKLAVNVEFDLADEDVLKTFFKGLLLEYYNVFRPYIEHVRIKRNRAKIFEKLFWLAERWDGKHMA